MLNIGNKDKQKQQMLDCANLNISIKDIVDKYILQLNHLLKSDEVITPDKLANFTMSFIIIDLKILLMYDNDIKVSKEEEEYIKYQWQWCIDNDIYLIDILIYALKIIRGNDDIEYYHMLDCNMTDDEISEVISKLDSFINNTYEEMKSNDNIQN